jgi:hypothetical protein
VSSPPFSVDWQKEALFRVKGDMFAHETKQVKEMTTWLVKKWLTQCLEVRVAYCGLNILLKGRLHLVVTKSEAPDVFALGPDDSLELGPFKGNGVDLRSSPIAGIYRYPTVCCYRMEVLCMSVMWQCTMATRTVMCSR